MNTEHADQQLMTRLRVKQLAEARGWTLSELQRRSLLSFPLLRRYWYNTADGSRDGPPLQMIRLDVLARLADALGVASDDLIEDDGPAGEE